MAAESKRAVKCYNCSGPHHQMTHWRQDNPARPHSPHSFGRVVSACLPPTPLPSPPFLSPAPLPCLPCPNRHPLFTHSTRYMTIKTSNSPALAGDIQQDAYIRIRQLITKHETLLPWHCSWSEEGRNRFARQTTSPSPKMRKTKNQHMASSQKTQEHIQGHRTATSKTTTSDTGLLATEEKRCNRKLPRTGEGLSKTPFILRPHAFDKKEM